MTAETDKAAVLRRKLETEIEQLRDQVLDLRRRLHRRERAAVLAVNLLHVGDSDEDGV